MLAAKPGDLRSIPKDPQGRRRGLTPVCCPLTSTHNKDAVPPSRQHEVTTNTASGQLEVVVGVRLARSALPACSPIRYSSRPCFLVPVPQACIFLALGTVLDLYRFPCDTWFCPPPHHSCKQISSESELWTLCILRRESLEAPCSQMSSDPENHVNVLGSSW